VQLSGVHVRLEPLEFSHVDGLVKGAGEDRSTYTFTWVPEPTTESVGEYIRIAHAARDAGTAIPFATINALTNEVVGSTRFMNIESWNHDGHISSVEIGSTWLAASAQRTSINTEAKLLMLTHAFEVWGVRRVTFKTDVRNARSRSNIERVGATFEGVLRNHMPSSDGHNSGVRDTAMYSIIDTEWPAAKADFALKLR